MHRHATRLNRIIQRRDDESSTRNVEERSRYFFSRHLNPLTRISRHFTVKHSRRLAFVPVRDDSMTLPLHVETNTSNFTKLNFSTVPLNQNEEDDILPMSRVPLKNIVSALTRTKPLSKSVPRKILRAASCVLFRNSAIAFHLQPRAFTHCVFKWTAQDVRLRPRDCPISSRQMYLIRINIGSGSSITKFIDTIPWSMDLEVRWY